MAKQYMFWATPKPYDGVLGRVKEVRPRVDGGRTAIVYCGPQSQYVRYWINDGREPPEDWTLTDEVGLVKLGLLGWTLTVYDWENDRV